MQFLRCTRKLLDTNWVNHEAQRIVALIAGSKPIKIILFGSAAENKMTDQSDFDYLVIHSNHEAIKRAQHNLRPYYPLSKYPVDIIWVTETEFKTKCDVGGICFVAAREGKVLYQSKDPNHD